MAMFKALVNKYEESASVSADVFSLTMIYAGVATFTSNFLLVSGLFHGAMFLLKAHWKLCLTSCLLSLFAASLPISNSFAWACLFLGLSALIQKGISAVYNANYKELDFPELAKFAVLFPAVVMDAFFKHIFRHKEVHEGMLKLDSKLADEITEIVKKEYIGTKKHERCVFNFSIGPLGMDNDEVKKQISDFIKLKYPGDNWTYEFLPQMNEVYATNFRKKNMAVNSDSTVQNIHCDGNAPNIFGVNTYRFLICISSKSKTTETVVVSRDEQFSSCLYKPGQYFIFDYNCQPHYVYTKLDDEDNLRYFLKLHFVVYQKDKNEFVKNLYSKGVVFDNRFVRARMNGNTSGGYYNLASDTKNAIFDNCFERNFAIPQSGVQHHKNSNSAVVPN